jgi:hypothetical protein
MIKTERVWHCPWIKDSHGFRIISGTGFASGGGDQNGADRMFALIALGIGIHVKLFNQGHIKANFFAGFAPGGGFHRFAVINEAAGNRPTVGGIIPLDQDDGAIALIHEFDNNVYGGNRVTIGHAFKDETSSNKLNGKK